MTTWTDIFGGSPVNPSDVTYQAIQITTLNNPVQLSWPNAFYQDTITAGHIIDISNDGAVGSPVIILGDAMQISKGQDILFRNVGAHTIQIQTFGGAFLLNIPTNTAFYIYLQGNNTHAGIWGIVQFGTGTSSADATTLAGYGLIALSNAQINVNTPVVVENTAFVLDATSRGSIFIWTGGAQIIDLPNPALLDIGNGYIVTFNNESNIGGTLTLNNPFGNIDTSSTLELLPGSSTSVICDGADNYYTIGLGTPTFFAVGYLDLDVSGSADINLSLAESQNIIQQYNGTLTGNINVIFPPTPYFNFIFNNTSGAFTLSVKVVGGSPIVVAQGTKIIVYNNGVNLVQTPTAAVSIANSKFIVQQLPGGGLLPNAQATGSLATGMVKNTTTTGILSIGTVGIDYFGRGASIILNGGYKVVVGGPASVSTESTEMLGATGSAGLYFEESAAKTIAINGGTFSIDLDNLPRFTSLAMGGASNSGYIDTFPQPYFALQQNAVSIGAVAGGSIYAKFDTVGAALQDILLNGYPHGYYPNAVLVVEGVYNISPNGISGGIILTCELTKKIGGSSTLYTGVPNSTVIVFDFGASALVSMNNTLVRMTVLLSDIVDNTATEWGMTFSESGGTNSWDIDGSGSPLNAYIITNGIL